MHISPQQIFQKVLLLLAWLLATGCASHSEPSIPESSAPPVTLNVEAESSVCIQLRNDSGFQVELRSLLVSKIRNKKYRVTQECGDSRHVLDIHVLAVQRGADAEGPPPEEDFPAGNGPALGMGVGSSMGGRSGVHVGTGLGFFFPMGTHRSSPAPGYLYTMIAELKIEDPATSPRVRQQTQLRVVAPAPSESAALPRLEENMAEAISTILP
ncbi:MAG: complement resistance protein TraT [Betaproteobacteria bacterium]|nr:complement resistance protein TraT [Betaproteobacteria bacterium]